MKIAIVGATGIVGRTVLKILEEKEMFEHEILLYATKKSNGSKFIFNGECLIVEELSNKIFEENLDFALFCTKENVSREYVKKLSECGTKVIDFSSLYRKKYPLIVPEINKDKLKGNIICNPNCSTIAAVMALYNIHQKFGLKRIVYSTYQAVSGAGKDALDDLENKSRNNLKSFKFPIYNNLIPYIGDVDEDGYTKEENKMMFETRKILGDKNIKITATCVRVPIDVCHSESINFQTRKRASLAQIKDILKNTNGVVYQDEFPFYPMPNIVRNKNEVYVGRLRKDYSQVDSFNIFVVSDNLRKGAAQNGVQILEEMIAGKK